ncbi:MAG TPA: hypothetical protein VEA79_13050 [Phenylobacterium sp.]|nr:hypothetical protein [Phenylobacterium sp.]
MISLILVAAVAAGALSVLSAYAPQLRSGNDGGAHGLSKSAVGFAALAKLGTAIGRPVVVTRAKTDARSGYRLLVVTPPPASAAEDVMALRPGTIRMLVVLPKWAVAPSPTRQGWVRRAGLIPTQGVKAGLLEFVSSDAEVRRETSTYADELNFHELPPTRWIDSARRGPAGDIRGRFHTTPAVRARQARTGPIENLQTISGRNLQPVVTDAAGRAVVAKYGGNEIYILADPDLLNTQGLRDPDTARAGLTLIDHLALGQGAVALDATLHGFTRSRNLLRLILEPPFLGGTLCLLAAAILAGVHAAARFGAPRPPERAIAFGKEALADSTAGLIHIAGREHRMGGRYAAFARADAARAVGAPAGLTETELDAFLDRLSEQQRLARFTVLRDEAQRASGVGELMSAARKLFQWRVEMTRERR